jgi:hypothetical protein
MRFADSLESKTFIEVKSRFTTDQGRSHRLVILFADIQPSSSFEKETCVSKSNWRRVSLAVVALVGATFGVGCTDSSVNPPLAKTEGIAPVAPESIKKEPPKGKRDMPRGSAKIGRDPSGINRNQ